MSVVIQAAFVAVVLALFFAPIGLIGGSTMRLRRTEHGRWWTLIGVSGVLLCLVMLDILATVLVARFGGAEVLARYALYSAYASEAVAYVALVTMGLAMRGIARTAID